jgi:hypothetical protein
MEVGARVHGSVIDIPARVICHRKIHGPLENITFSQQIIGSISASIDAKLLLFFLTLYIRQASRLIKNLPVPFGTLEGKECV